MSDASYTVGGIVHAAYHTMWLVDQDRGPQLPFRIANGLVVGQRGAAVIATGVHTGAVNATVEVHLHMPAGVDTDDWDAVAEVSMESLVGTLSLKGPTGGTEIPPVSLPAPGSYRLRVHARERDHAIDGVDYEPIEHYRLVMWPAESGDETIYKQTDRYGAELRQTAATAPPLAQPDPTPSREEMLTEVLRRSMRQP